MINSSNLLKEMCKLLSFLRSTPTLFIIGFIKTDSFLLVFHCYLILDCPFFFVDIPCF